LATAKQQAQATIPAIKQRVHCFTAGTAAMHQPVMRNKSGQKRIRAAAEEELEIREKWKL
jgi:hypothetical protein